VAASKTRARAYVVEIVFMASPKVADGSIGMGNCVFWAKDGKEALWWLKDH
jgi:hypothetical protein